LAFATSGLDGQSIIFICRPRSARSFARRDAIVIDIIDGDASIRTNLGELETVTTLRFAGSRWSCSTNCGVTAWCGKWQKLFQGRFAGLTKARNKQLILPRQRSLTSCSSATSTNLTTSRASVGSLILPSPWPGVLK
jgi:hypothetical protein